MESHSISISNLLDKEIGREYNQGLVSGLYYTFLLDLLFLITMNISYNNETLRSFIPNTQIT